VRGISDKDGGMVPTCETATKHESPEFAADINRMVREGCLIFSLASREGKEVMKTEHPILMTPDNARLSIDGLKTQTRRVMKIPEGYYLAHYQNDFAWVTVASLEDAGTRRVRNPYGHVGDKLWLCETWATIVCEDDKPPRDVPMGSPIWFKDTPGDQPTNCSDDRGKWRSSIFLPRWASRLDLLITNIRVQRLQDISDKDVIAEGLQPHFLEEHPV